MPKRMSAIERIEIRGGDASTNPRNRFKVPSARWNRWSDTARCVFNSVFMQAKDSQMLYLHPKTDPVPKVQWQTTAWNVAWIAADAVQDVMEARAEHQKAA
jgi:hypothetical protein